MPVVVFIRIPY